MRAPAVPAAIIAAALFCAAFLGALALTPALAQAPEISDAELEGRWLFEAESFFSFDITQEISGEMEISATGDGQFSCTLWVADHIPEENVVIRTEQLCVAVRDGDALQIDSVIISVDPPEYQFNYIPDNFTLTIESPRRMSGVMHAAGEGEKPGAVFTRGGALLS